MGLKNGRARGGSRIYRGVGAAVGSLKPEEEGGGVVGHSPGRKQQICVKMVQSDVYIVYKLGL